MGGATLFELIQERLSDNPQYDIVLSLTIILVLVLVLPFAVRRVEEHLEYFFFAMGVLGVIINVHFGVLRDKELLTLLLKTAATTPVSISGLPIGITQVVLVFGLIFLYYHKPIYRHILNMVKRLGLPVFSLIIVFVLGLISSLISVIVTAVILAEIVHALPLPRRGKLEFTVYAAFSVGMGAALTPVGEPLSTIAISKLNADFFYLLRVLGEYIVAGVSVIALFTAYRMKSYNKYLESRIEEVKEITYGETLRGVIERAFRVYIFVAALELLGASLMPLTIWYFLKLPPEGLYWLNTISAVVDNATLTAAEVSPAMTVEQLRSALIALLISGGMLIPGNIPNIVAAGRLKITMKEWAKYGVPVGFVLLLIYFIILHIL